MRIFSKRRPQGRPAHPDVLTPAEWRVLEQVRAGRTNQEIADHLGVSHNTVKTHVANMLAKLDVQHRHELAAWQGAPTEASRSALGRLSLATPWAGRIALVGGAVVAGVLFLVAMQAMDESGSSTGASAVTPAPTAITVTPEPTESPSPTPTPDASPRFAPLTVGPPIELPEGVVLYVWGGCTECDGPARTLRRVQQSNGVTEERTVMERTEQPPYLLHSGWIADDTLYIFECSTGYCGPVADVTSDASVTLYRSVDGGTTWEPLGTQPLQEDARVVPDPANWGFTRPGDTPAGSATGLFEVGGIPINLTVLDNRGLLPQGRYIVSEPEPSDGGRLALRWVADAPFGWVSYLSIFESDGAHVVTYSGINDSGAWLDEEHLVATISYWSGGPYRLPDIEYGQIPSIIDLRDGTVRPILDPFVDTPSDRNQVMGVSTR
ncbi:MAG: LuxR C-terminal-related transcriptional regulator [Dehalococcoidia bacterium]|nr:LuxR C-terminal-related transcriptional regulator [Dehalococcoidia bacterium]